LPQKAYKHVTTKFIIYSAKTTLLGFIWLPKQKHLLSKES